jgi:threonine dehydrogenase-like Zn-dependent dehydrogenase
MKAALIEKPGVLTVRDIPEPEMGDYDALCRILYGTTCVGTDQHLIHGRIFKGLDYPVVLGHESIGQVVKVGPKVQHYKEGDLVTRVGTLPSPNGQFSVAWGGFAEFGIARDHWAMRQDGLPRDTWNPFRINQLVPTGIDAASATMIITWRETLSYITRMGVQGGAKILVIGSGANGLAFAAHAGNLGANHIAQVGNSQREALALNLGAHAYFDYKANDVAASIAQSNPEGFDFIIDVVGRQKVIDMFLPMLKPGGMIGVYGVDESDTMSLSYDKAQGSFVCYKGHYDEEESHGRVVSYMRSGLLKAEDWLDMEHPIPLQDINKAFKAVVERRLVKALVAISSNPG